MAKDLSYFFPEQVIKREAGFIIPASNRILDGDGKPINWEFVYPDHKLFKEIKNSGQKKIVENGKIRFEFDQDTMFNKAILETVIYPDLKNAELQDAYGVFSDLELLEKMLEPDEIEKLARQVSIKIGLIDDPASMLEDAKN